MRAKMLFGIKSWRQRFAARVGRGCHPGSGMGGRDMFSQLALLDHDRFKMNPSWSHSLCFVA
jgi:hypothetical protein